MATVIFFNHKVQNCGVYQYGFRVFNIIKATDTINYIYKEISSFEEYKAAISDTEIHNQNIKAIIYNYHQSTMPWLQTDTIQRVVKNIGIPHESREDLFDIVCNIDPNAQEQSNRFSLPRPIFEDIDLVLKTDSDSHYVNEFIKAHNDISQPIFGSFGFGFDNKGFDKIVTMVNDSYDNAVIKFVIPVAHFDPGNMRTVENMRNKCLSMNKKEGIKILITHAFFSNDDILRFLHSNTMNIFLYDTMHGRGISSTIDYALSVKKPIGISDSYMFRNIYDDSICLYKNNIESCLPSSSRYCSKFLEEYSHSKMIDKFKQVIQGI
jgi:hypothetical protein